MTFKVDDRVVYPAFGIGRVVGLVTKSFFEAESQLYYEVIGDRSTVWVQVDEGSARGLRRLTRHDELAHYSQIVGSRPITLNQDHRQRQLDLRSQLKLGTMQGLCEMVRDLSARGWVKTLNDTDLLALRKGRDALCQEWAAAEGVSLPQATAELTALLLEGRQRYQVV
jgi:RNA polymerase-interacting CarD/CdnL/TRCF family regulator